MTYCSTIQSSLAPGLFPENQAPGDHQKQKEEEPKAEAPGI